MTESYGYPEPLREVGYDQTAVPSEQANEAPDVLPTVEELEGQKPPE